MYYYANVIIERPDVRAVPLSALTYAGDKTYCWMLMDGHAKRAEVRTGVSDGEWTELITIQRPSTHKGNETWSPVDGSEQVILVDLSILTEDAPVEVSKGDEKRGSPETSANSETPPPGAHPMS